jgi:hypothetical protein
MSEHVRWDLEKSPDTSGGLVPVRSRGAVTIELWL